MESSVLRSQSTVRAAVTAIPSESSWHLTAVVFAATSVIVGLVWDISWHMTIGRDTFWTPAHMAIYTGGIVAGLASGWEVLRQSFLAQPESRAASVRVWRLFYGPLGGWLCIWGAVAMLTSAPFDDWWHNAYGLDVQILSPPHSILALGFLAILIGATLLAAARQTRDATLQSAWIVAYTGGLVLTIASIMFYEYEERVLMHTGIFYEVTAAVFPMFLVAAGTAVRLKWPATAVALVYTLVMLTQLWLLPAFSATPLLGPIRQPTSHMVPLNFPLLLLLPAFAIDMILQRTNERGPWLRALLLGGAFLLVFAGTQWPFAEFLIGPHSRNWIFHTGSLPYMVPPESLQGRQQFVQQPPDVLVTALAVAFALAVVSARAGISWGGWLRSVRR